MDLPQPHSASLDGLDTAGHRLDHRPHGFVSLSLALPLFFPSPLEAHDFSLLRQRLQSRQRLDQSWLSKFRSLRRVGRRRRLGVRRDSKQQFVPLSLPSRSKGKLTLDFDCFAAIPNQVGGPFYSILSRLFIILVSVVLFLSEVGGPRFVRRFFELFVPFSSLFVSNPRD